MLTYFLKSGVCLAIFYLFYKLLLEKEPIHIFKRIYLLGGLLLAFAIPLITFTTTVEVEPLEIINYGFPEIPFEIGTSVQEATPINYWPIILWTIYGFGVVLFGLKFLFNLFQIGAKISVNTKQKMNNFTHILLDHLCTPYTFFNYIFFNKQAYLKQEIPKEVFWHEETHAKQKHSFDVVLIEILQVVFWLNPLLYFIKKDVKLNHEFLADRAVLNKGVSLTAYQEILLAYSANSTEPQLANALNYSSIKKRFKIMKTKTSKKAVWIKSIILLPLVAVLVYGFSEKVTIEKVIEPLTALENLNIIKDEIRIYINKNDEVTINNKFIAFNEVSTELIKISKENPANKPKIFIKIEGHLSTPFLDELEKEISKTNFSINEIKVDSITLNYDEEDAFFKGTRFMADSLIANLKDGEKIVGIPKPKKEYQDKATPAELKEYNKIAKHYNAMSKNNMVIKSEDVERLHFIYNKMTEEQKNDSEAFPNFPPPPPKQGETQSIEIENEELSSIISKYNTLIVRRNASENSINTKKLNEQLLALEKSINEHLRDATQKEYQDKSTPAELKEYNKIAKHYNTMSKNNMVIKSKDVERLHFIYNKMTEEQKNDSEAFPNFLPPPPKQGETQSIEIENKELSSIISKYNTLIVKRNASKNSINTKKLNEQLIALEKNINEHLRNATQKEYQDKATPAELKEYNKIAKHYNTMSKSNMVIKGKDVERLHFIYNKMTEEQKNKEESFPNFPPPPQLSKDNIIEQKEKQIEDIKKYVSDERNKETEKEFKKLKRDEPEKVFKFVTEDGEMVEVVENLIPQLSIEEILEQNALDNYIKKNNVYENLRFQKPHYKDRSSAEKKELDHLCSELGSIYFKLSRENKRKTKRPIYPLSPYIKLMKDGKKYYKKRSELTEEDKALLPPPPPPPALGQKKNK